MAACAGAEGGGEEGGSVARGTRSENSLGRLAEARLLTATRLRKQAVKLALHTGAALSGGGELSVRVWRFRQIRRHTHQPRTRKFSYQCLGCV